MLARASIYCCAAALASSTATGPVAGPSGAGAGLKKCCRRRAPPAMAERPKAAAPTIAPLSSPSEEPSGIEEPTVSVTEVISVSVTEVISVSVTEVVAVAVSVTV